MREIINFNEGWYFHKGDIVTPKPRHKGYAYFSAKTQRMHLGPASPLYRHYDDDFFDDVLMNADVWEKVNLPHDFIIGGEVKEFNNSALGFFDYDKAWYVKRFTLSNNDENKRITLYFEALLPKA